MVGDGFTCALDAARLDEGERELAAALALSAVRGQEALRRRRERLEPRVRIAGLALCAAGAVLSGWAVAVTRPPTCPGARDPAAFFQVTTPVFAVLGVVFWFLPRVAAAIRAWAPGVAARAAPRIVAPLRRGLPSDVTYRLEGGEIVSRLSRPRRTGRTPLSRVHGAFVGSAVACLFGPPPLGRLLRVVWLPGEPERRALVAALEAAKVPVLPLPAGR